ncbi:MAG: M48 family metalloprotease [Bacteroidota bacterium]
MRYLVLLGISFVCACTQLQAQSRILYVGEGCNFADEDHGGMKEVFDAHDEAKRIVNEILEVMKVSDQSFVIVASGDVQNAFATRDAASGTRYILYNVRFLEKFKEQSLTRWAAYSVLAHELAHHVLNHDLNSMNFPLRKQQELAADAWSAQALTKLGATMDEVLAGVRTFDLDGESSTHPHPTAREQQIALAFVQARDNMGKTEAETDVLPGNNRDLRRRPITLDYSRKNRWNLFSEDFLKNAEIDEEKVTIRYQIPADYTFRPLIICLSANNDAGILPGATMPDDVVLSGTGSGIFFDPQQNIVVWNYRREGLTPKVAERANLQLFIYDLHGPTKPKTMAWVGPGLTLAAGIGAMIYGQLEIEKGRDIYDVYRRNPNPFAQIYTQEKPRERWLEEANDHKVPGDWLFYGGMTLTAAGSVWLYDKFRQKKTFNRDVCGGSDGFTWRPTVHYIPTGFALGASLEF